MSAEKADHHDAALMMQVYDLRRETTLREARKAINGEFWPASYQDVQAIVRMDHPLNAAWRQTLTYWEMLYGMVRHGIVHPEYWMETNGEGLFLYAKIVRWLPEIRREINPVAFRHSEWVAANTEEGKRLLKMFGARVDQALAARRG